MTDVLGDTSSVPRPTPRATATTLHAGRPTPTDRLLTASLVVAPLVYLAADTAYAANGWDDGAAGALEVVGAIGYGLVVLRVVTWLRPESRLAMWVLLTGLIGMVGNAAYGFEAIHMSLGDTQLVNQPGAANLIKPIGLFFPLSFLLVAWALRRLGHRAQAFLVLAAVLAWPVAHIGDVAAVAVPVNVVLVVAFGSLAWTRGPSTAS